MKTLGLSLIILGVTAHANPSFHCNGIVTDGAFLHQPVAIAVELQPGVGPNGQTQVVIQATLLNQGGGGFGSVGSLGFDNFYNDAQAQATQNTCGDLIGGGEFSQATFDFATKVMTSELRDCGFAPTLNQRSTAKCL